MTSFVHESFAFWRISTLHSRHLIVYDTRSPSEITSAEGGILEMSDQLTTTPCSSSLWSRNTTRKWV